MPESRDPAFYYRLKSDFDSNPIRNVLAFVIVVGAWNNFSVNIANMIRNAQEWQCMRSTTSFKGTKFVSTYTGCFSVQAVWEIRSGSMWLILVDECSAIWRAEEARRCAETHACNGTSMYTNERYYKSFVSQKWSFISTTRPALDVRDTQWFLIMYACCSLFFRQ